MIKPRHIFLLFTPVLLLTAVIFFVRFVQYRPLYPKAEDYQPPATAEADFKIPIYEHDPIIGDKKAPKTVIVFADFACGHCAEQFTLFAELLDAYPQKIKIIWKGLPVVKFPLSSILAHHYGFCLREQGKFADFYPLAFNNYADLSQPVLDLLVAEIKADDKKLKQCLSSSRPADYVMLNENLARFLNIQAVPTVFINNKQVEPPALLEGWTALLGL